jgi:type IV pilus assembly protein PilE
VGVKAEPDERLVPGDQRSIPQGGGSDNRDMRHTSHRTQRLGGFTLIELLIVMAVATILLTIAVPAYQDSVRKSRRADAVAGLTQLQLLQERHRANNPAYATTIASLPSPNPTVSPEKHYALSVAAAAASSYTITATAQAGSPQFSDTRCRSLSVTMSGGNISHSSTDASGTVDSVNANRCWTK